MRQQKASHVSKSVRSSPDAICHQSIPEGVGIYPVLAQTFIMSGGRIVGETRDERRSKSSKSSTDEYWGFLKVLGHSHRSVAP